MVLLFPQPLIGFFRHRPIVIAGIVGQRSLLIKIVGKIYKKTLSYVETKNVKPF